ncbi:MAG: SDR family oxidoreductase [Candidatus Arcticimaribacter sp.]
MQNLFDLSNKVALVTGCKRGIGKAMAIALAKAGADIIGVSQSLESAGSEVEKEVLNLGRKFTASILSFQGGITVPGYAASKGAIAQMTKAFANEWASKGVNVNAIAPGYISTDNTKALQEDPMRSESILSRIPAARWGQPEDIAGPLVFLCSQAADYIHGSVLTVDGGWMAR